MQAWTRLHHRVNYTGVNLVLHNQPDGTYIREESMFHLHLRN